MATELRGRKKKMKKRNEQEKKINIKNMDNERQAQANRPFAIQRSNNVSAERRTNSPIPMSKHLALSCWSATTCGMCVNRTSSSKPHIQLHRSQSHEMSEILFHATAYSRLVRWAFFSVGWVIFSAMDFNHFIWLSTLIQNGFHFGLACQTLGDSFDSVCLSTKFSKWNSMAKNVNWPIKMGTSFTWKI